MHGQVRGKTKKGLFKTIKLKLMIFNLLELSWKRKYDSQLNYKVNYEVKF